MRSNHLTTSLPPSSGKTWLGSTAVLSVSLTLLLTGSGCVKHRPPVEGQGENFRDLVSIPQTLGKTCQIHSKNVRQRVFSSLAQKSSIDATGETGIKNLDIVNFDSDCPFLQTDMENIELLAPENSTLQARYEVNAKTLVLYKIVAKTDLSHLEAPYAQPDAGGMWKVPVGGFEIGGFYNIEAVRNADNRETNIHRRISVPNSNFKNAEYLTINRDSFHTFRRLGKRDVYPKDYFKGEWYYVSTVVGVRQQSGHIPGDMSFFDSGFRRASRIRFRMEKDFLVAENQNVDPRRRDSQHNLNMTSTIRIPIRNVDYRARPDGASTGLEEEEINTRIPEEARFLEAKLNEAKVPEFSDESVFSLLGGFAFFNADDTTLVNELNIDNDYFSFVLENRGKDELVRYSFVRVNEDPKKLPYKPRIAFKTDMSKYGYYTTQIDQIVDAKLRTETDFDKINLIERYRPDEDIIFHFSRNTPQDKWIRDIGREAVSLWTQAFAKAGLAIKIRLDESSDASLGDLRYNVLNLSNDTTGRLVGFGPRIADAQTGQILAATTNLYVENLRQITLGSVRRYVSEHIAQRFSMTAPGNLTPAISHIEGLYKSLLSGAWIHKDGGEIEFPSFAAWDATQPQGVKLPEWISSEGKRIRQPLVSDVQIQAATKQKISGVSDLFSRFSGDLQSGRLSESIAAMSDEQNPDTWALDTFIEKYPECKDVRDLVDHYAKTGLPTTEEFLAAAEPCVIPLTQMDGVLSIVHELGHNIGLRHNFMGSHDKKNFIEPKEYDLRYIRVPEDVAVARSSSIMDYFSAEEGVQVYPGGYDIAALKFAYLDKVKLKVNVDVRLNTDKPIKAQPSAGRLLEYEYCTDEDRLTRTNVFCKWHDVGSTASEAVAAKISQLYRSLSMLYRYDTATELWNVNALNDAWIEGLLDLKTYYDHWRLLVAQELGERNEYIPRTISEDDYKEIVDRMMNSARGEEVKDFLKARNMIAQTLIDLVFLPNRYCVVSDADGKNRLPVYLELSVIRKNLQRSSVMARIESCRHPAVQEYLKNKNFALQEEIGFDLEAGSYDLNPETSARRMDFAGALPIRVNAMEILSVHGTLNRPNYMQNFFPSVLDEPDISANFRALFRARLMRGIAIPTSPRSVSSYAVERTLDKDDIFSDRTRDQGNHWGENFAAEANLLKYLSQQWIFSNIVPGDPDETAIRTRPYKIRIFDPDLIPKKSYEVTADVDEYNSFGSKLGIRDSDSTLFIARLNELRNKLNRWDLILKLKRPDISDVAANYIVDLQSKNVFPERYSTMFDLFRLFYRVNELFIKQGDDIKRQSDEGLVLQLLLSNEVRCALNNILPDIKKLAQHPENIADAPDPGSTDAPSSTPASRMAAAKAQSSIAHSPLSLPQNGASTNEKDDGDHHDHDPDHEHEHADHNHDHNREQDGQPATAPARNAAAGQKATRKPKGITPPELSEALNERQKPDFDPAKERSEITKLFALPIDLKSIESACGIELPTVGKLSMLAASIQEAHEAPRRTVQRRGEVRAQTAMIQDLLEILGKYL